MQEEGVSRDPSLMRLSAFGSKNRKEEEAKRDEGVVSLLVGTYSTVSYDY